MFGGYSKVLVQVLMSTKNIIRGISHDNKGDSDCVLGFIRYVSGFLLRVLRQVLNDKERLITRLYQI